MTPSTSTDPDAADAPRARRVPGWIPVGLLAWGVFAGLSALAHEVERSGFDWVDPARIAVSIDEASGSAVDPRWQRALEARLGELRPFRADDPAGLDAIEAALAALPFVAEVERPELVWPDGATVRLRFEQPAACLRRGAVFLCVSESGRVLPGGWMAPPRLDGLPLPVLGRLGFDEPDAVPGAPLPWAGLEHGLALARTIDEHLSWEERAALGTIVIDGENAASDRVDSTGAVIHLEGRRAVFWGRTPDIDAPGALPTELKWRSVAEADALARSGELAWRAVDVRWDQYAVSLREDGPMPEPLAWRTGIERSAASGGSGSESGPSSGPDRRAPDRSGGSFEASADWLVPGGASGSGSGVSAGGSSRASDRRIR